MRCVGGAPIGASGKVIPSSDRLAAGDVNVSISYYLYKKNAMNASYSCSELLDLLVATLVGKHE